MPGDLPRQLPVPADDEERRVVDEVRQYGWHIVGVAADEEGPGFAYSIGLTHSFGHPEVIMFGLPVETMFQAVNIIGEEIRAGRGFAHRDESDAILEGHNVFFRTVARDQYREFVGYARWFYGGNNFDLLQCIWPDHSQRFPWHPDFPAALQTRQPLLTDDSEWKFNAGKNRAVFTTKPVINQRLPILRVSHDVDGDWQFLCGTTNQVADGALVRLSTIIRLDPTILELGDMPAGWRATRPAPGQPWRREATSDV